MIIIPTFSELEKIAPYDGNETGGIIYQDNGVSKIYPIPSLSPSEDTYIIGRKRFFAIKNQYGENYIGVIHTHPNGPRGASERDLSIASRNIGYNRFVWHPRSGAFTTYNGRTTSTVIINTPLWFRLLAKILFY